MSSIREAVFIDIAHSYASKAATGCQRPAPALRHARQYGRLIKFGSERSLAVARTVKALTSGDEPPGPSYFEAIERPVGRAWVRRVTAGNTAVLS
jgi:hypothetical protein